MKRIRIVLLLALFGLAVQRAPAPPSNYSLEYSAIDLTGGAVTSRVNPGENLATPELQGLGYSRSADYAVTSILRWPASTAAANWTLYE